MVLYGHYRSLQRQITIMAMVMVQPPLDPPGRQGPASARAQASSAASKASWRLCSWTLTSAWRYCKVVSRRLSWRNSHPVDQWEKRRRSLDHEPWYQPLDDQPIELFINHFNHFVRVIYQWKRCEFPMVYELMGDGSVKKRLILLVLNVGNFREWSTG